MSPGDLLQAGWPGLGAGLGGRMKRRGAGLDTASESRLYHSFVIATVCVHVCVRVQGGAGEGGQENCIPKLWLPWAGSWRQVAARGCLRMLLLHTCVNMQVREQLWVCLGI